MSWRTRFRARQYVKGSLWVAPLIAGLGGVALAELTYWFDLRTDLAVLQYSPETATAVVSATIAAVVSLTVNRRKLWRTNFLALEREPLSRLQAWTGQFHPWWGTDGETPENYADALRREAPSPEEAS